MRLGGGSITFLFFSERTARVYRSIKRDCHYVNAELAAGTGTANAVSPVDNVPPYFDLYKIGF